MTPSHLPSPYINTGARNAAFEGAVKALFDMHPGPGPDLKEYERETMHYRRMLVDAARVGAHGVVRLLCPNAGIPVEDVGALITLIYQEPITYPRR